MKSSHSLFQFLPVVLLGLAQGSLPAQGIRSNVPVDLPDVTDTIVARPPAWVLGPVRATPFLATSPSGYSPAHSLASANCVGDFADITAGSDGAYSCATGYDCVTGLGVLNSESLVPAPIVK